MNRNPDITRREQQTFARDVNFLHFAVRACPCDGVGCSECGNKMKYYDDPIPLHGRITAGMNKRTKQAQLPSMNESSYTLLLEPRFSIVQGDRVTPFGMREFEVVDEILTVSQSMLTYIPINPRMVKISFRNPAGGVVDYKYNRDFTIDRQAYGRVRLWSKQIKWVNEPQPGQEKFSARYGYIPDFEVEEIPPANMNQGQRLMQVIPLKKITVGGIEKSPSHESSKQAVGGMVYE